MRERDGRVIPAAEFTNVDQLATAVRSLLPRLWQWADPAIGKHALAIEPGHCSMLGRAHDTAAGRMPFLDPGEARSSWLTIGARLLGR